MKRLLSFPVILGFFAAVGCSRSSSKPSEGVITVFNAGSLAGPLGVALDSFARPLGLRVEQENAGSLESARKITELGRVPDVIALADRAVFTKLLIPKYVASYIPFARNRMVLIHSRMSRFANEITPDNWYQVLTRPGVQIGRSDPDLDPAGYRTLIVYQLAQQWYKRPRLASALAKSAPPRNIRPKSADLVALVQTGNLDYAWGYESVALDAGLPYVILPPHINLGDSADSTFYATATVRVAGATPHDTIVMRGEPIVYGIATPRNPPHGDIGARFITFVMSPKGQAILRRQHLTPAVDSVVSASAGKRLTSHL